MLGVSERTVERDLKYWIIDAGYNNLVQAYITIFIPDQFSILNHLNNQIKAFTSNLKKNL